MSVQMKTTRNCAGSYTVSYNGNEVEVYSVELEDGNWWIANCDYNSSDPLPTKREAVQSAQYMLVNWEAMKNV